ncbi:hypothetical protein Tsubulata_042948 [Turnera subulata]|uniref:Major facilitator superfamily (MFS) profile domain-containing protein n=1 Tax=Turnera subulata TaxID=218843 RepID=A0A9Q0J4G2_9ROSI|nr:hypothetical protein Tsubulata_042948 [Turnera subulata]
MAESTDPLLHLSPASNPDKNTTTIDEFIERCLGSFGWRQFLQCFLVALAQLFDSQQVFISIYADAEPPWHCIKYTTSCSSSSDICKIPKHEWSWDAENPKTIISEWSLQCASPFIKGLPAASFFMGWIIGGFTLATLADSSLGRKKLLLLSCLIMSVASLATIFSTNGIIFVAVSLHMHIYSSISLLHPTLLLVTESPKWLFDQGREEEAFAILKELAPGNDKSLSFYLLTVPDHKQNTSLNHNFFSSFNTLLKKKWARHRMFAVMMLAFGIGMVYFGVPLGVGNLGYNIYLNVLFNALLELPSYLVTFIIVDKWNKRSSIFWFSVLSGILSILCVYPSGNFPEEAKVGLELGSLFCGCIACNLTMIYTTELFPTSVRNSATSMMRQSFALSGVFSSALVSTGKTNSVLSYAVFGIMILFCSLFVFLLPEIRGAALLDSVHEEEESKENLCILFVIVLDLERLVISQTTLMAELKNPLLHQSPPANADSNLDENTTTIDELIEKCLGRFGWRQFLQCVLVSLAKLFDAQQVFISVYADAEPPWHCIDKSTGSVCNSSTDICKVPRHEWAWDDGSPKTIISEWSLQCASPFIKALPATSFFMGSLIGGFTLATLADSSLGRKKVLLLSCIIMSFASLATVFSTDVWIYSAFRFISGIGWSSIGTCVVVLSTEKVGKNWRGQAGSMSFLFFTLGYISLPGIAYMCRTSSWRSLYIYTSIPIILYCILVYFVVTESPKWLFIRGHVEEAFAVVKELTPENDTGLSSYLSSVPQPHKQDTNLNQNFYSSFNILLKRKWARNRMLAVMVLAFGIGMVYFGMPLAVGNLGYSIYLSVLFNALLELPSYLFTFIFLDIWNRRSSIFWFFILTGILSILCAYPGRDFSEGARIVLELGSYFWGCTACNLLLIYTTELFPTSIRNSATSMMRQALALSGIFSPALISAGKTNSFLSYGVFGIIVLLCSFFIFLLPETRGTAIADTVYEEEESIGSGDLVV